jgi:hypothetical protein
MTFKLLLIQAKKFALPSLVLIMISFSLITINCADEPTSLGLKFLPSNETTGVRVFDSYIDSMAILSYNKINRVNTYSSQFLIVGQSGTYNSKALIKFSGFPGDLANATVNSAVLKLRYRNYYFPVSMQDSLGQVSFDIYRVIKNIDYQSVTLDKVNASTFGTVSQGTHTGSPTADSQTVNITLNNNLARDWLKYAANSNYTPANYGIVLSPNASSNVLKGFYSSLNTSDLRPTITIIYTLNATTDTLINSNSETLFLADADLTPPAGEFYIQAGISYNRVLRFDMSKIPKDATINDAQVFLYLDSSNSKLTSETIYGLNAAYINDSTNITNDTFAFRSIGSKSVFMFRFITPFQRWLRGETNYGIIIIPSSQSSNLDLFAFYDINASSPNKRPKVVIYYTPRVTP